MRPISKEQKEIQGTYEASREGEESVQYMKYAINPTAPDEWPAHIQKLWYDRCQDLKEAGYLMKAVIPLLRKYIFYILMADEAEKHLLDEGFIENKMTAEGIPYETISKWVSIHETGAKGMERIGARFGWSPLDVHKIPAVKKDDGKTMTLLK